jgi:hypothetical protein
VLAFLAWTPTPARAQAYRSERVDLHGFGGWSWGRTDDNRFLGADRDGEYTKANFALKVAAEVHPTVRISAQINWRNAWDGSQTSLDYAFADWQLTNSAGIRAGKVKHPFGIYSEVAGIGTVRPFLNLPQAVYGPLGLVSKSYRGVGFHGTLGLAGPWSVRFDVYGGGIEYEQEESALEVLTQPQVDSTIGEDPGSVRDVGGIRLVLETPLRGLTVGASGYTGTSEGVADPRRFGVLGGQAEYLSDRVWVRAERVEQFNRFESLDVGMTAGYVELAVFLTEHLQPAIQYNRLRVRFNESMFPVDVPHAIRTHEEWSVGLNYWVVPEMGFKASWHRVEGNLISALTPAQFQQAFMTGVSPRPETTLVQVGVQFSF